MTKVRMHIKILGNNNNIFVYNSMPEIQQKVENPIQSFGRAGTTEMAVIEKEWN